MIATARPARLLCRSVTICVLAGAILLGAEATASADTPLRFWHFNMCGARLNDADCNGGDEVPVSNAIKGAIETWTPDGVSLNEACESQWGTAYWNLNFAGDWPMHSRFVTTRSPTDSATSRCNLYNGGRRFGNALFSKQTILLEPSATSLPKTDSSPETRKLWCMVVDLPRDTVYCTVHITPATDDTAPYTDDNNAQIARVASVVNQWVDDGIPVVLMGDFNVPPGNDRLDRIYYSNLGGGAYGRFEEVDEYHNSTSRCRCGEATFGSQKIDYIFVSARDFYSPSGDATSQTLGTASNLSDHRPLRGSATLDATP